MLRFIVLFFIITTVHLFAASKDLSYVPEWGMHHYLREGAVKLAPIEGAKAVYVVGNMGVGKSTFINYLLGYEHLITPGKLILRGNCPQAALASDQLIHGVTWYPSAYSLGPGDIVFCDTPGYGERHIFSYQTSMLLSKSLASEVKKIIVVFTKHEFNARGNPFIRLIQTIATLVHQNSWDLVKDHFVFVFNTQSLFSSYDKVQILKKVMELENSYKKDLIWEKRIRESLGDREIDLDDLLVKVRESYHFGRQEIPKELRKKLGLTRLSAVTGEDAECRRVKDLIEEEKQEQELLASRESRCYKFLRVAKAFVLRDPNLLNRRKTQNEIALEAELKEVEKEAEKINEMTMFINRYLDAQIALPILEAMRIALEDPSGTRFLIWSDPQSTIFRERLLAQLRDPTTGKVPKEALNFGAGEKVLIFAKSLKDYVLKKTNELSVLFDLKKKAELRDSIKRNSPKLFLWSCVAWLQEELGKEVMNRLDESFSVFQEFNTEDLEKEELSGLVSDSPLPPYLKLGAPPVEAFVWKGKIRKSLGLKLFDLDLRREQNKNFERLQAILQEIIDLLDFISIEEKDFLKKKCTGLLEVVDRLIIDGEILQDLLLARHQYFQRTNDDGAEELAAEYQKFPRSFYTERKDDYQKLIDLAEDFQSISKKEIRVEREILQSIDLLHVNKSITEKKNNLDPIMHSLVLFHRSLLKDDGPSFLGRLFEKYEELFSEAYKVPELVSQKPELGSVQVLPFVMPKYLQDDFFRLGHKNRLFLLRNDSHSLRLYFYGDYKEFLKKPLCYRAFFRMVYVFSQNLEAALEELLESDSTADFDFIIHRDKGTYRQNGKERQGLVRLYFEVKANKKTRDLYFNEIKKMFKRVDEGKLVKAIENSLTTIDSDPDYDGHLAEYKKQEGVDDYIFSIG